MSFTHHTPGGQPDHSERQARGRGDARADQRSHVGLRYLRREYAGQYARDGEVKDGGVGPCRANRKKRPLRSAPKACVLQGTTLFCSVVLALFHWGLPRRRLEENYLRFFEKLSAKRLYKAGALCYTEGGAIWLLSLRPRARKRVRITAFSPKGDRI